MKKYYARYNEFRPGTLLAGSVFLAALGVAFLVPAAAARADIHDNLVVHLRFDGDVQDYSGRGNHGTIMRPGTDSPYVPGVIGQAFQTKGQFAADNPSGNYITLGNPSDLNFDGTTDVSFSWWGQYNASDQHGEAPWLANKDWWSTGNRGWALVAEGQSRGLRWNLRPRGEDHQENSTPYSGTGWDDGAWHHYAVVFTHGPGASVVVYQDGAFTDYTDLKNTGLYIGYSLYSTNIFQDGTGLFTHGTRGDNWDKAAIDDLGIWRRALTDDEVSTIYNLGLKGQSALDPP